MIRWGCSFCAMAIAEYPSQTLMVSKLLARRRKLRSFLRSGSSSTTMILARFMGSPSLGLSVRILVVLLFGKVLLIPETLLHDPGNIIGNSPDLLLQGPRIGVGGPRNQLGRHPQGAAGLQLRQCAHLLADPIHHDPDPLHVGGGDHKKRFDRTARPHRWKNQILIHVDT